MAESDPKGSEPAEGHGSSSWGEVDLGDERTDRSGQRPNRNLAFAATQIQAPAPQAEARSPSRDVAAVDDDPVARLFRADLTVRAPSIPAVPNETELRRWNATMRASTLFDEQVRDPAPAARPAAASPRAPTPSRGFAPPLEPPQVTAPAAAASAPGLELELDGRLPPLPAQNPRRDLPIPPARLPAPPPPAAELPVPPPAAPAPASRGRATGTSGVRARQDAVAPASAPRAGSLAQPAASPGPQPAAANPAPEAADATKRKRIERGPTPRQLALLGLAAAMTLGAAAFLMGLWPGAGPQPGPAQPSAPSGQVARPQPGPQAAKAAAPQAAASTAAAPAQPATPPSQAAAAQAAPAQRTAEPAAAAPAAPQAAEPDRAAAPAPAAKAAAAEAAPQAAEPEPAAAPQAPAAKAAAAEAAPAPQGAEDDDESAGARDAVKAAMAAARRHLADDEPERAEALMRELLADDPRDHHAMELLVRALINQDRGKEALPYARKMVSRRSRRVPYRLLLGDVLLMVGDEAGARAQWQKALELAPNDRDVKMRLGL